MPTTLTFGKRFTVVSNNHAETDTCYKCSAPGTVYCDFVVQGHVCKRVCCAAHSTEVSEDVHICDEHNDRKAKRAA